MVFQWWRCGSWWRWCVVEVCHIGFDVIFLSEPADSVGVTQFLVIHQEVNHATLRATAETLVAVALGIDHKRADMPVIVKWTEAEIAHALLLQFDVGEVADDLLNLRRVENLVDDMLFDFLCHRGEMGCNRLSAFIYYTKALRFGIEKGSGLIY